MKTKNEARATILPTKHQSGTMPRITLTLEEAKAQYEMLLQQKIQRKAEQWRITGHLDPELLPILDRAVEKAEMDSRAEWIVATLRKALKA